MDQGGGNHLTLTNIDLRGRSMLGRPRKAPGKSDRQRGALLLQALFLHVKVHHKGLAVRG